MDVRRERHVVLSAEGVVKDGVRLRMKHGPLHDYDATARHTPAIGGSLHNPASSCCRLELPRLNQLIAHHSSNHHTCDSFPAFLVHILRELASV